MAQILTEQQIESLLSEKKVISSAQVARLKYQRKAKNRPDKRVKVRIRGDGGTNFVVRVRQTISKPMDFSVILAQEKPTGKPLNLIRCNGHHSEHSNRLERTKIPRNTCHVHRITEKYQRLGVGAAEKFAVATTAYCSVQEAVDYLCGNFGFQIAGEDYPPAGLFQGHG